VKRRPSKANSKQKSRQVAKKGRIKHLRRSGERRNIFTREGGTLPPANFIKVQMHVMITNRNDGALKLVNFNDSMCDKQREGEGESAMRP
jgi:hypothetical protein